jgi:tetratricopeptide (TPR) repeat protein
MAKVKNPANNPVPVVPNDEQEIVDMDVVTANVAHQATDFWEHNQKYLVGGILGIAAIVFLWYAYTHFIKGPKEIDAANQIAKSEQLMSRDSFEAALKGTAGFPGFVTIAKKFSGTKAGNMANFYAGQCYLNLGQFAPAISYLESYSPADDVSPVLVNGMLGDAYSETNKMDEALKHYETASVSNADEFLSPYYLFKLGLLNEKMKKYGAALNAYNRIKSEYPESLQGRTIDMYIGRVEPLATK